MHTLLSLLHITHHNYYCNLAPAGMQFWSLPLIAGQFQCNFCMSIMIYNPNFIKQDWNAGIGLLSIVLRSTPLSLYADYPQNGTSAVPVQLFIPRIIRVYCYTILFAVAQHWSHFSIRQRYKKASGADFEHNYKFRL